MAINTLLIQFTLLRNTSFWFQFSQCNKDLYIVIGIFESNMSGFMLHLGPWKICFSIDSFYLRSLVFYFLQDSLFYMALSRLNFTMLFGVSEMKRLSCAWVLLALLLFFIDCLSRLMLPDIHTPKVTLCCAEGLR